MREWGHYWSIIICICTYTESCGMVCVLCVEEHASQIMGGF